jgi:hypothetical protein
VGLFYVGNFPDGCSDDRYFFSGFLLYEEMGGRDYSGGVCD